MRKMKYSAENSRQAWFYLLPAIIIISIFNIYPILRAVYMSFHKGTLANMTFSGVENYQFVLSDPKFHIALKNTAIYAFVVVPISLLISMLIALMIFNKIKNKGFFETIFFIPYLTSVIAIGVVFRYLFNGQYGFINYILSFMGAGPINFLDDIAMSIPTLIIFGIWNGLAFNIIILLAGLRNIDTEYYKVADMFGATDHEKLMRITLPQLVPTLTFLLTVNLINAFKVYSQVFAIFNGKAGIANSATTAVFYIYNKFHVDNKYGAAMAATVILFLIILSITMIQNKLLKRVEE